MGIFQCYYIVPSLEKIENLTLILPRNFPAVVIIFARQGTPLPPLPTVWGGAGHPSPICSLHLAFYGLGWLAEAFSETKFTPYPEAS